ncbi:hypothetical protein E4U43_000669 [Claviceps pusilla]|uniref:Uncharacterized protein n=1 Tax=Claviceps pusilla TaxID=123648 RepID=A0A9P7NAA9_9HYPO|nr:hypothetical protein E4U43_000669 [Claviceps pusilla]
MKFAAAIVAAAVGVQAYASSNSSAIHQYTTEVVDQYVTYCPGPMHVTHGSKVYVVTKSHGTTLGGVDILIHWSPILHPRHESQNNKEITEHIADK